MFLNYIVKEDNFLTIVRHSWSLPIRGCAMFCLWQKLKRLQPNLRPLQKKYSDLAVRIKTTRTRLDDVQEKLIADQGNSALILEAKQCSDALLELQQMEEEILAQKAKIEWLQLGDANNAYFMPLLNIKPKLKAYRCLKQEVVSWYMLTMT